MKEIINRFHEILQSHPFKDYERPLYLLEYDIQEERFGVVFALISDDISLIKQKGFSKDEFLKFYSEYTNVMPENDNVIFNFLEFRDLEAFRNNIIEKAYMIEVDENKKLNDREFKGLTGRPIALDESVQALSQIAVPNVDDNFSKLPQSVKNILPSDNDIIYVRYNIDMTRISFEKEYNIAREDINSLEISGIDTVFLRSACHDILDYTNKDEVKFAVKTTGDKKKIYFSLTRI